MKLSNEGIKDKEYWTQRGFSIPQYDREAMCKRTIAEPMWLHFGSGNIFRAYMAMLQERLLNEGLSDKGIIAAEGYDFEILDKAYKPFDNLSIFVTLIPDGTVKKSVVGSVAESVKMNDDGMARLYEIFSAKSLQMVSLTITEKGYDIYHSDGTVHSAVVEDFTAGPQKAKTFLGKLTALCLHRFQNGAHPLTIVSMDNCSQNGKLLQGVICQFAYQWVKNGLAPKEFLDYITTPEKQKTASSRALSFPCTMIDKITPYPDAGVAKALTEDGIEDMTSIVTALASETAPFVNAEEPEYLVVEDSFPNGRPPLEKVGVIFTDGETVDKAEKMKVCTCLNPLHTALSVFACMLGFTRVSDAMKDPDLHKLVSTVAKEGLPVVVDPGVISPQEFINTVINVRLPNPYIPDTPQRIATDTSRKLAVRFGETLKAYMEDDALDVSDLRALPLVLAGWCRYLLGIDDNGEKFQLDPDPMLGELCPLLEDVTIGKDIDCASILKPILSKSEIFGIDLYDAGIAKRVIDYFEMMVESEGAVRETLVTALNN